MANHYDRIFKENLEDLIPFLARRILGIEAHRWEEIPDELQLTLERKPDFLKRVHPLDGSDPYLLHIEFQTLVDAEMPYRMLEYFALLLRKYKTNIRQVVIQVGIPDTQSVTLSGESFSYRYGSANLRDYDYELFLQSDIPEEVILAILANFRGVDPRRVIIRILERLQHVWTHQRFQQKYANQLYILSRIRSLEEETFKILEDMPFHYNIEQDYLYKRGMQQGVQQGIEKGIEKGIEQKNRIIVNNLLKDTNLTDKKIAELAGVTVQFVEKIRRELNG